MTHAVMCNFKREYVSAAEMDCHLLKFMEKMFLIHRIMQGSGHGHGMAVMLFVKSRVYAIRFSCD